MHCFRLDWVSVGKKKKNPAAQHHCQTCHLMWFCCGVEDCHPDCCSPVVWIAGMAVQDPLYTPQACDSQLHNQTHQRPRRTLHKLCVISPQVPGLIRAVTFGYCLLQFFIQSFILWPNWWVSINLSNKYFTLWIYVVKFSKKYWTTA